ncbi:MAG: SDR family NAD(P)-dependent oxidoreductase [Spirochaetaceae bacterium]|nr:SDR family NAD(P)-dependent oxidoreductase [Spirochaetaceae bacterium]
MNGDKGFCALITGASRGLGRAFARECAARGMDLLLVALPDSGLPDVGSSLAREFGIEAAWLEADLTEPGVVERLLEIARGKLWRIGLLVNNAGIGGVRPFMECGLDCLEATVRLNALVLVRITRAVLDSDVGGPSGPRRLRILNVASLGASFPMPTLAVYAATKSFVLNFSLALREELAGRASVSVLCPNAFATTAEVGDYVARFGLLSRLACLPTERIAREALDGAERGMAIVVPGAFNRALAAIGRLLPRKVVMRAIGRTWGGFYA